MTKITTEQRKDFLATYYDLAKRAFNLNDSEAITELEKKYREKFGYSKNTGKYDLLGPLLRVWRHY